MCYYQTHPSIFITIILFPLPLRILYSSKRTHCQHFLPMRLSSSTEYPWKKTRRFPIRALSLLCSPIILMYALLGENGIIENYNARIQLLILQEEIQKAQSQNLQIHRNIQLVKTNPKVALSYYQRNTFQGSEGTTYFVFKDENIETGIQNDIHLSDFPAEQILSLISNDNPSSKDKISTNSTTSNTITSDEFVTFLGERSSLTYEKIDTSTKVLGYIAGTVKSVQSNWSVPSFQSDHTINVTNPQKRKEALPSSKNNK